MIRLWETIRRFFKNQIELAYDPAIALLDSPKRNENRDLSRYLCPHVHSGTFTVTKKWQQPKCPLTDKWTNKTEWGICIQWNIIQP